MNSLRSITIALGSFLLAVTSARSQQPAQPDEEAPLNWQKGPSVAKIGGMAEIQVPEGFMFVGREETRQLLESMGNPTSGNELGLLASEGSTWFLVFQFSDTGYIKDNEKDKLDAGAMLKSIQKGTEVGNKERRKRGWAEMKVVGWEQPPKYDEQTRNLEWAIRGESGGEQTINYNSRLLGRSGVMEVSLVVEPDQLAATLPTFKQLLTGYSYTPGSRYAEYRQGDKLAEYGLAALVTGGAAVAAAKSGLLAKAWKFIVIGGIAMFGLFKRIVSGLFAAKNPYTQQQP